MLRRQRQRRAQAEHRVRRDAAAPAASPRSASADSWRWRRRGRRAADARGDRIASRRRASAGADAAADRVDARRGTARDACPRRPAGLAVARKAPRSSVAFSSRPKLTPQPSARAERRKQRRRALDDGEIERCAQVREREIRPERRSSSAGESMNRERRVGRPDRRARRGRPDRRRRDGSAIRSVGRAGRRGDQQEADAAMDRERRRDGCRCRRSRRRGSATAADGAARALP